MASAILKGDGSKGYYYKCCTINCKGKLVGYCSIEKMMRMKLLVIISMMSHSNDDEGQGMEEIPRRTNNSDD